MKKLNVIRELGKDKENKQGLVRDFLHMIIDNCEAMEFKTYLGGMGEQSFMSTSIFCDQIEDCSTRFNETQADTIIRADIRRDNHGWEINYAQYLDLDYVAYELTDHNLTLYMANGSHVVIEPSWPIDDADFEQIDEIRNRIRNAQ